MRKSALLPSGPDALFLHIACEQIAGPPLLFPLDRQPRKVGAALDPREDEHVARAGGGREMLPQAPRHLFRGRRSDG